MIKFRMSEQEADLILDIRDLTYGELHDILFRTGRQIDFEITPKEAALLRALRETKKLDTIIVHDSEPATALVKTKTPRGRECTKKIKF